MVILFKSTASRTIEIFEVLVVDNEDMFERVGSFYDYGFLDYDNCVV